MVKIAIKKQILPVDKTLHFSNYKFKDLVKELKPYKSYDSYPLITRNKPRDKDDKIYKYYEQIPVDKRRIYCSVKRLNGEYLSFEAILNPANLDEISKVFYYLDLRDSLNLELIEWKEGYLGVKSNSLIISSWWLNIFNKREVNLFIKKAQKQTEQVV